MKYAGVVLSVAMVGVWGCSENVELAGDATGMDAGLDARTGGDGPIVARDGAIVIDEDGGSSWACYVTECARRVLACGDCEDNDGDGLVDARDPECLGPCDDTEGPVLLAGIAGEAGGPCLADCYFDFGNGSGNDDCRWDHRCDPRSIAPSYDPEGPFCAFDDARVGGRDCPAAQSGQCLDFCRPLTPNGCDCFGCCTFDAITTRSAAEGGAYVWIGSVVDGTNEGTCTFDEILDTSACRPCTPVADCFNDCGECEVCVGRSELPRSCTRTDAGVPNRCSVGVQECGTPGDANCPADYFCITGCCIQTLI